METVLILLQMSRHAPILQVLVKVGNGKEAIDMNFLVDSGAVYTLLPQKE